MRLCKFFFVGCLSLVSLASHAETLNGLYQVLEPVSSQSPQERDQATQRAVQTLVIRLTGDAKAADHFVTVIKKGGKGVWGPVPMPPHPQVSDENAQKLAAWILSM